MTFRHPLGYLSDDQQRSTLAPPDFSRFLIRNPVPLLPLAESMEAKWNFAIEGYRLAYFFLATAYVLYLWGGNEAQDHVKLSRASSKRTAITNSTSQSERSEASWQARDPCPAALCNVAAVSGGPFACPIESPDPTLNWEFPVPIFPDFYPPAERLDETECGQFDSFCLHETLSVAGLPHALGEALSSSLDSLSRSARHAAAFPGFAAYPQSLPSYRRRVHGYDGFKR
ncbi:hypothetical protein NA56DRAFT_665886 [Hyaloscypha hepaticicola]|uniref:Uncharacterized protein n=1 Tax=Hyaloscypha hepaticicola TaxID=2082293 RepID=A0A2J6PG33_9HELO|nr:hypothetical protein NA56DRAFT_665886 [Hyaloscypha hepaticicola]